MYSIWYELCICVCMCKEQLLIELFWLSCSAGVGRTGTLITIDIALAQAAREGIIDIAGIVCKIRSQRMKMVQSSVSELSIRNCNGCFESECILYEQEIQVLEMAIIIQWNLQN